MLPRSGLVQWLVMLTTHVALPKFQSAGPFVVEAALVDDPQTEGLRYGATLTVGKSKLGLVCTKGSEWARYYTTCVLSAGGRSVSVRTFVPDSQGLGWGPLWVQLWVVSGRARLTLFSDEDKPYYSTPIDMSAQSGVLAVDGLEPNGDCSLSANLQNPALMIRAVEVGR